MAAITFTDGTSVDNTLTQNRTEKIWVSPSTADSNDTVTLPTITGRTPTVISCFDTTTGDAVTATVSGQVVTIDAAGGTTNHQYVLKYLYL